MFEQARKVRAPLSREAVKSLRAGQWILLSGVIHTARDQAHRRMFQLIKSSKKLPIELKGAIIYYCGPSPTRPGRVIGSAGPTTSSRMDKYTPKLLQLGVAACIGKGERSEEVREAFKRHAAVYLVSVGGAGAFLSERIKQAEVVAWPELGAEAVYRLVVEDFPCLVAYDSKGRDFFARARKKFEEE